MSSQGKNEESDKRPNQENKSAFNQEGQSVQGNQTNIGKVEGNIEQVGDNYYGPVTINQQFIAPKPPRPDYINMAPDLKYFVQRPHEYNQLRDSLISPPGDTVAISAALRGAGGFGKTTLAQRLCYDEAVQQAHPDGILWVELGERPDNLVGKVNDLTEVLTSGRPTVVELNTAAAELAHAMGVMRCLMVIDDLWNAAHAVPFLRGGPNCTRLITTRKANTLPIGLEAINVDTMRQNEAIAMLVREIPEWEPLAESFTGLAIRLGNWPLLLKLTNSALYRRVEQQGLQNALAYVNKALEKRGLIAFDAKNPQSRGQAVAATLGVSLDELNEDEQQRLKELAVFPEDTDVPLTAVTTLWGATGNLDDFDTEELCATLFDHSLLLRYDGRTLRLHDVIRQYLLDLWGDQTPTLHQRLLDAYNKEADWPNGPNDGYYFQQLPYHLKEAGKTADLHTLLLNFTWLQTNLYATNIGQLLADYGFLEDKERPHKLVEGALRLSTHVLARDKKQLAGQLRGRLLSFEDEEIKLLCEKADEWRGEVWLSPMRTCQTPPGGLLLRTLSGHLSGINDVVVTPDGKFVISSSMDNTVKVWELTTGEEKLTLSGHSDWVETLAITPDGKQVVSGSHDNMLKVWNLETGNEELTLEGHSSFVNSVAVTPDGSRVVSVSSDGTLKVWNLEKRTEVQTIKEPSSYVRAVALTPDGRRVVSSSFDGSLKVRNLETRRLEKTLVGHSSMVGALAITPDGKQIVSGSEDNTLKVWNLEIGKLERTLEGHSARVSAVVITPNGKQVVSGSKDNKLKMWNLETGKLELTLEGHSSEVSAVAVTPDGKQVVSGSLDITLKVWDISNPLNTNLEFGDFEMNRVRHTDSVQSVAINPNGKQVVSASDDNTLKVWNLETGMLEQNLVGHTSRVSAVTITPDGKIAVSGSNDNTVKVWNLEMGEVERTLTSHSNWVSTVAITPDSKRVLSGSNDNSLKIWNLETGELEATLEGHSDKVEAVVITADGKWAVSGSWDKTLKVWYLETKQMEQSLAGHSEWVSTVTVTPDSRRIVSGSWDNTLKVWDILPNAGSTKETSERELVRLSSIVGAVVVTPDGKWIISISGDNAIDVWDIETGKNITTYDLDERPLCIAIAPNGSTLVAGNLVGQIFWFDIRTP